jgi:hypothetical protein
MQSAPGEIDIEYSMVSPEDELSGNWQRNHHNSLRTGSFSGNFANLSLNGASAVQKGLNYNAFS